MAIEKPMTPFDPNGINPEDIVEEVDKPIRYEDRRTSAALGRGRFTLF